MTTNSNDFVQYVLDQLSALREVSSSRFFGGTGLSCSGTQFGMVMEGTLYFVVNDTTRPKYEHMGSQCFSYRTKTKQVAVKKYYAVPADVIEDSEQLVALAKEAVLAAQTAQHSTNKRSTNKRSPTKRGR